VVHGLHCCNDSLWTPFHCPLPLTTYPAPINNNTPSIRNNPSSIHTILRKGSSNREQQGCRRICKHHISRGIGVSRDHYQPVKHPRSFFSLTMICWGGGCCCICRTLISSTIWQFGTSSTHGRISIVATLLRIPLGRVSLRWVALLRVALLLVVLLVRHDGKEDRFPAQ